MSYLYDNFDEEDTGGGGGDRIQLLSQKASELESGGLLRDSEPSPSEAKRQLARQKAQRYFKLPLTFKKPKKVTSADISPTPVITSSAIVQPFQKTRPRFHFLVADYGREQINVSCERDLGAATRPDWSTVRWIHLDEMNDSTLDCLKRNLPAPILIKDITRETRKYKVEEHEQYLLLVLHLVTKEHEEPRAQPDHSNQRKTEIQTIRLVLYLFFKENILLTVTESPNTSLAECILTRLSRDGSRIRNLDSSYLLYYIIKFTLAPFQLIINYHAQYLETMEEKITFQEIELNKYQHIFHEIHEIRRELQQLRSRINNVGEAIDDIREIAQSKIKSQEITTDTYDLSASSTTTASSPEERVGIFPHRLKIVNVVRLQFKHLSNNAAQMAAETVTLQEICSWLADLVFQTLSQRMNQTMKTLTLISMIFIPLTFIVGVYGTNFKYLPELDWRFGYAFLWSLCIGVVVTELIVFRRLRWI